MRYLIKTTIVQLILMMWPTPQTFAENVDERPFATESKTGFDQVYNMDYDEAMGTFARLHSQYPQHPAPPLYMATTLWLRELLRRDDLDLNKFVTPTYFDEPQKQAMPLETHQRFAALVDESRALAEHALVKDPDDVEAQYFLATSYGVNAAFAITVDHSKMQAFEYGKKSYRLHSALVAKHPQYYDSYMTLGMYEYIAGNLPWYVKWVARMAGYHGSVDRGLQYLRLTAEKGQFAADDARVMLLVLDARDARYSEAVGIADDLRSRYPRGYLLPITRAQILEKMGSKDAAASAYEQVIAQSDAGVTNFDQLRSGHARYEFGQKMMELDRYHLALSQFQASVNYSGTSTRDLALAWLGAGQALDALGRRSEAVSDYRLVLSLQDFDGAHSNARNYIERPYRGAQHRFSN
jgi:tetratricopeptide (TPR) repeat protein